MEIKDVWLKKNNEMRRERDKEKSRKEMKNKVGKH